MTIKNDKIIVSIPDRDADKYTRCQVLTDAMRMLANQAERDRLSRERIDNDDVKAEAVHIAFRKALEEIRGDDAYDVIGRYYSNRVMTGRMNADVCKAEAEANRTYKKYIDDARKRLLDRRREEIGYRSRIGNMHPGWEITIIEGLTL